MGYQIDEYALYLAHAKTVQWFLHEYPDTVIRGSPEGIGEEVWTDPESTLKARGVTAIEEEFLAHRWEEYESLEGGDDE